MEFEGIPIAPLISDPNLHCIYRTNGIEVLFKRLKTGDIHSTHPLNDYEKRYIKNEYLPYQKFVKQSKPK